MKRILLITSVLPWPLRRNGGAQRSALLKKALSKWGQVDVFAVGSPAMAENTPEFAAQLKEQNVIRSIVIPAFNPNPPFYIPKKLQRIWTTIRQHESYYSPHHEAVVELDKVLKEHQYDLIVSRYLQPAIHTAIKRHRDIPAILDFDDIDWSTFEINTNANPWPGIGGKIGQKQVFKVIKKACDATMPLFESIFVTSREDQNLLTVDTKVLPNIPYSERDDVSIDPLPAATTSHELLFVGDLQFPPNRNGLDRFLASIWPKIRQIVPDAVLNIVGRGLKDEFAEKWRKIAGVNVIGFAPDLMDCYRRCAFTVVPIYFGGGTKIKVLESLAFGRTVVTTPQAMRGYADLVAPNPSVAVAATDEEFATACIKLLQSHEMRDAMADRGRQIVNEQFSFARFQSVVDETIREVFQQ